MKPVLDGTPTPENGGPLPTDTPASENDNVSLPKAVQTPITLIPLDMGTSVHSSALDTRASST